MDQAGVPAPAPTAAPPQPLDLGDEATQAMGQALAMVQATQFGVAAVLFRRAADIIEVDGERPAAKLWAEYCRAEGDLCEGFDLARNGNRAKSLEFAASAANRFNTSVLRLVETLPADERESVRAAMVIELNLIKMFKAVTEMMQDILSEDFDTATDTAQRLMAGLEEDRTTIKALKIPEETKTDVGGALAAVSLAIGGLRAYAEASQAINERRWDAATKSFAEAKRVLRDAGDAYSGVPRLASQAQMWPLLVEALVDPARNRGNQLRAAWENFDRVTAGMVKLAHAVGATEITNNNVVNNTAQIQNRIDIQISLINEFEDRTRDALTRLRDAIRDAPVDEKTRKEVLEKIDAVTSTPKHEGGFFAKFNDFAANSAAIVENVAKVAGPVAVAWNLFAPFFGMPAIPIPGK